MSKIKPHLSIGRKDKLLREQAEMRDQMKSVDMKSLRATLADYQIKPIPKRIRTALPHHDRRADGLCECGCGSPTSIATKTDRRTGSIKGHPKRFISGHHGRKPGLPYVVSETTECWVWQRSVGNHDYGCLRVDGKTVLAHRYYYERYKGPIPDDMQIDHLCCNKLCVNPAHLEIVTSLENTRRYLKKKYSYRDSLA